MQLVLILLEQAFRTIIVPVYDGPHLTINSVSRFVGYILMLG